MMNDLNSQAHSRENVPQRRLQKTIFIQALVIFVLVFVCAILTIFLLFTKQHQQSNLNQTVFQRSINDAAEVDETKVVNTLFALNPNNASLLYKQVDNIEYVKAVAWMSEDTFTKHYTDESGSIKTESVAPPANVALNWVTLVPQLQSFCKTLEYDDPSFRIKQYLGLDPNRAYDRFVEIWVEPSNVFRPCIDTEPSDNRCELPSLYTGESTVAGIDDYPAFFNSLKVSSYTSQGAPWTRLGYTYDWAKGQRGIGASEYVLVPSSRFLIDGSYRTKEYCQ